MNVTDPPKTEPWIIPHYRTTTKIGVALVRIDATVVWLHEAEISPNVRACIGRALVEAKEARATLESIEVES